MFNFTENIYDYMVKSAIRYESHFWDCVELPNGQAITFAMDKMKPYDICVFDEDDNMLDHNFSMDFYLNKLNS